jgi:nicotinamidase-related amidase
LLLQKSLLGEAMTKQFPAKRYGAAAMAAAVAVVIAAAALSGAAQAQNILEEWATIKAPPPPELKAVTIDPKKTALIVMDFNQLNCVPDKRARCFVVLPKVQKLLAEARARGMVVVHSYTPNMTEADIVKSVGPIQGERVLQVRGDKFFGNDLEKYLKDKGVTTVVNVGTSANGAVLFTTIGASQRGFKAVVPIDTMPADTAYQEQLAIWEIANGPGVREDSTLTRTDMLKF